MSPELVVDIREWRAAAKELKETSSRTCVDFTNGQGLSVVSRALKLTKHGYPAKIAHELGASASSVSFKTISRGKNKGKVRVTKGDHILANNDTLAHRILAARRIKTGKFGIEGQSLSDKARNLIKARAVSVNFIRAGWIPALKRLIAVVRKKPTGTGTTRDGAKQRGVEKGGARPAAFSLRSIIEVDVWNSAMQTNPKFPQKNGNAYGVADKGLREALAAATLDMQATLEKRLAPDLKSVSTM